MPNPQVPVTGNIGPQGNFPLLNSINIVMSNSDYMMAYPDMSASVLRITSSTALTAMRSVIAPLTFGFTFSVQNATTGNQAITFRGTTGNGVIIPYGQSVFLFCDGNNYVTANSSSPALVTTGTLSLPVSAGVTAFDKTRIVSIGEAATPTVPGRFTLAGDSSNAGNYIPYLDIYGPGGNAAIFGVPVKAGTIDAQTYLQNGLPFAGGGGGGDGLANVGIPNAAGDGTTNDAAALATAATNIKEMWLPPNSRYFIGTTTTINCDLRFISGAQLIIGNGVTLTINGQTDGPLTQCFVCQGSGRPVLVANRFIPAEWFGAIGEPPGSSNPSPMDCTVALNQCLDSIVNGQMVLQNKWYYVSGTLSITKPCVGIKGAHGMDTIIMETTYDVDIINVQYPAQGGCAAATHNVFEDFALTRNVPPGGTCAGLAIRNGANYFCRRVKSYESIYDYYLLAAGGTFETCWAGWGLSTNPAGIPRSGWYMDTSVGIGQCSPQIRNSCFAYAAPNQALTNTAGLRIVGPSINDIEVDGFSTSGCDYGIYISAGPGSGFVNGDGDLHFRQCILDMVKVTGIYINGLRTQYASMCEIDGGWITPDAGNTQGIYVNSSTGVTIQGVQILNGSGSMLQGIYCNNCSDISMVNNNIIAGSWAGIQLNGCSFCSAVSNVIRTRVSTSAMLMLTGSYNVSLMSNTINATNGSAANAILLDATTSNNFVLTANVINPTNITTRIKDEGSGNSIDESGGGGGGTGGGDVTNGLIEFWPLNEGSGSTAYNTVNSGNNLTVNGTGWYLDVTGLLGTTNTQTALFNGSSGYLSGHTNLNVDSAFSICAGIYMNAPLASTGCIIASGAAYPPYWVFNQESSQLAFYGYNTTAVGLLVKTQASPYLQVSKGYYVTLTYDGSGSASGVKMYIGPTEVQYLVFEDTLAGSFATDGNIRIGWNGDTGFFNGAMANIRIYNRVLTLGEIQVVAQRWGRP